MGAPRKISRKLALAVLFLLLAPALAVAYGGYATSTGASVQGYVAHWLNGSGVAQPVSTTAPLPTARPDVRATGQTLNAATLNAAVTAPIANGEGTIGWTVTGLTAAGATLTAEASNDGGTTWSAVNTTSPGSGALSTTVTADGQFRINAGGHTNVRLRVSTIGTGTVTLAYSATAVATLQSLSSPLPAGTNAIGTVNAATTGIITNPSSTLTLTSTTTAYTAGQLIANSATAASVVVPSFPIVNSAGGAAISRLRLYTNDTTSTAWGGQTIQVDLWLSAPTFSSGDRGTWSPATGAANHLASFSCVMSAEYGDGAFGECSPNTGSFVAPKLTSGTSIYWTLDALTGSGVTGASKAFTLVPEVVN